MLRLWTFARTAPAKVLPHAARGLLLWVCGTYTWLIGLINYVLTTPDPGKERALAYQRILAQPDAFGWALVTLGVIAVVGSYLKNGHDRIPMTILFGGSLIWGATFLYSILFFSAGLAAAAPLLTWSLLVSGVCWVGLTKLAGSDVVR